MHCGWYYKFNSNLRMPPPNKKKGSEKENKKKDNKKTFKGATEAVSSNHLCTCPSPHNSRVGAQERSAADLDGCGQRDTRLCSSKGNVFGRGGAEASLPRVQQLASQFCWKLKVLEGAIKVVPTHVVCHQIKSNQISTTNGTLRILSLSLSLCKQEGRGAKVYMVAVVRSS